MHIADIDFAEFYRPAFSDGGAARAFVDHVRATPKEHSLAKIALYQAARMLWLADRIEEVARGRPAIQVLFFLIAAEAVAKMVFNFKGRGDSEKHVKRFFGEVCSDEHRHRLDRAFSSDGVHYLAWQHAVQYLYKVRCDVVHEGVYFEMAMENSSGVASKLKRHRNSDPYLDPDSHISCADLRQIILEGAVRGCRMLLTHHNRSS